MKRKENAVPKTGKSHLIAAMTATLAFALTLSVPTQAEPGHGKGHGQKYGHPHGGPPGQNKGRDYRDGEYRDRDYGGGDYRDGHYHRGRYHRRPGWAPVAVVGGLAAGYVILDSRRYYYTPPPRNYVPPQIQSSRPCRTVYQLETVDGYEVKTGATMCFDERGVAYIVRGTEFPVDDQVVYQSQDMQQTLESECRLTLRGVWFDFDRSVLKPGSDRALDEVLELLQNDPDLRLEVQGHTDSVGSDAYNMRLSQERANAVVDWLIDKGVDENRLYAQGYGESVPVADNSTDGGRAENRRVEVINPECER